MGNKTRNLLDYPGVFRTPFGGPNVAGGTLLGGRNHVGADEEDQVPVRTGLDSRRNWDGGPSRQIRYLGTEAPAPTTTEAPSFAEQNARANAPAGFAYTPLTGDGTILPEPNDYLKKALAKNPTDRTPQEVEALKVRRRAEESTIKDGNKVIGGITPLLIAETEAPRHGANDARAAIGYSNAKEAEMNRVAPDNPVSADVGRDSSEFVRSGRTAYDASSFRMTPGAHAIANEITRQSTRNPFAEAEKELTQRKTQLAYAKDAANVVRDKFLDVHGPTLFAPDPNNPDAVKVPKDGRPDSDLAKGFWPTTTTIPTLYDQAQQKETGFGAWVKGITGGSTSEAADAQAQLAKQAPDLKAAWDQWQRIQDQHKRVSDAHSDVEMQLGQLATQRLQRQGLLGAPVPANPFSAPGQPPPATPNRGGTLTRDGQTVRVAPGSPGYTPRGFAMRTMADGTVRTASGLDATGDSNIRDFGTREEAMSYFRPPPITPQTPFGPGRAAPTVMTARTGQPAAYASPMQPGAPSPMSTIQPSDAARTTSPTAKLEMAGGTPGAPVVPRPVMPAPPDAIAAPVPVSPAPAPPAAKTIDTTKAATVNPEMGTPRSTGYQDQASSLIPLQQPRSFPGYEQGNPFGPTISPMLDDPFHGLSPNPFHGLSPNPFSGDRRLVA